MQFSRPVSSRALVAAAFVLSAPLVACHDDPVGPPLPNAHAIVVTYCAPAAPTWVAFRDGDGSWTRALPVVSGSRTTFQHTFTSDRAAIASSTPVIDGEFTLLSILYGTPAELATEGDTTSVDCVTGSGKTLHGTVAGLDATEGAFISVGSEARASVFRGTGPDFTIDGVASGPQDLLAVVTSRSPGRLILRRNVDLPDGGLIPNVDFASAEAFDAVTRNVTIENLGADNAVKFTELLTPHGQFTLPVSVGAPATTEPYLALPADKLLGEDLELLHVSTGGDATRTADVVFRSPADLTLTLGPPMTAPTLSTLAADAPVRLRAQFAEQPEYDRVAAVVYYQPASTVFVISSMTSAYAALAGGYVLDVPDLSGVSGFDASWGLRPGTDINWSAFRTGGTFPIGRNPTPENGATRRTSQMQGILSAP